MNTTNLSKILAISSPIVFFVGYFYKFDLSGAVGFFILISAIIIYFFFNTERDKRKYKEKLKEENKKAIANRSSCSVCGVVIEGKECPNCNIQNPNYRKKSYSGMYALSILLGILGGIIAWASLRNENPNVGTNCLIVGIITTVVSMIIGSFFLLWVLVNLF